MLLADILPSFALSLEAQNKAQKTRTAYLEGLARFQEFLQQHQYSQDVTTLTKAIVEEFLVEQVRKHTANSAITRYTALRQFFQWCADEEEIRSNPMEKVRAPKHTDMQTPLLSEEEIKRLLKTCDGKDFFDRRDTAIIRLFLDTGLRRSELANLRLEDIDLAERIVVVYGKGRRHRLVPIGVKTSQALDRYIRIRHSHAHAQLPNLWLGQLGAMTHNGIYHLLVKHAEAAGIQDFHPHLFRHTFSHEWLQAGGQEGDLMQITGWKSRAMLERYGAAGKTQRARTSHRQFSPGDKI